MEESAWFSKCRTFKVSGSFPRGRPRKNMERDKQKLDERKENQFKVNNKVKNNDRK